MQNKKFNLYSFNKNSIHVRLFKWCWNIDPPVAY